jgi:hypothetical protein
MRFGVIDVVTRQSTAQGEPMTTSITEETGTAQATATGAQPKAPKKARVGARRAHVAPAKAKSGKKATPKKKAPKGAKGAKPAKKESGAREGSKTAQILDLLKRSSGATLAEIMKASGWQAHSVRGFISGTLRKKLGLAVSSTKGEDGERSYSVKS